MHESPRTRRLKNDLLALQELRAQSTVFDFVIEHTTPSGLPEAYALIFHGRGIWRPGGSTQVLLRDYHEVSLQLNASYPRLMPTLAWRTPLFHPNVASTGVVCLGGYGKYWVPSLSLDELCSMLWDMIRYGNFDVASPYNREAAYWASSQGADVFPLDARSIRDRGLERSRSSPPGLGIPASAPRSAPLPPRHMSPALVAPRRPAPVESEIVFLE